MDELNHKYAQLEKELDQSRIQVSELSAFKNQLLENEANLTALIENTNDSIWSIDKEFRIKTLNSIFKKQFQLAFGVELKNGSPILEFLPDFLKSEWHQRYSRALQGESFSVTDNFDYEGVAQFVEVRFNPIRLNNSIVGATIFAHDITVQEHAIKNLQESNANQKAILENVNARIWSIDTKYNIIVANSIFKKDYKRAFNADLEKGIYSMINLPKELEEKWLERYTKALKGLKFSAIDEFHFEGVPQFTETFFNPITINHEIIGASCLSYDVSEQKKAEEALRASEYKFKTLIANIPSVTYNYLAYESEPLTFISKEVFNLCGYKAEEFIEKKNIKFDDLIHPDDISTVKKQIIDKLLLRQNFDLIYRIIHKSGEIIWVHERGRGNYNENNELVSIDGTISDITKQKWAEEELIDSEQRFRFLAKASLDLLTLKNKKEILSYLTDSMSIKLPECIIVVASVDESNQTLTLSDIGGIDFITLQKIHQILGQDPVSKTYLLNADVYSTIQKGRLTENNQGIHELLKGVIPQQAGIEIEALFPSNKVYIHGIKNEAQVVATLFVLSEKTLQPNDFSFVESLANIVSIVLQKQLLLEALYYSEEKLRKVFENSIAAISIHDEKSFLLVNKAWEKLTGYTAEESKSLLPFNLAHPKERKWLIDNTLSRLKGEEVQSNYLLPLMGKDKDNKWVDMSASVIDFEGKLATLVISNDITDRKKKEQEIAKLSTAIINAPLSIVITDIDGTIEYVNPHFCQLTGYSFYETFGNNPRILQSGLTLPEVFKDLWATILKGEVWYGEFINKKKNGDIYYESARIAPILDDNGIIINFIAIKEDNTERIINLKRIEKSEQELKELNAKKDKFFSIIAHDLRSPFSGLVGLTTLLKENYTTLSPEQINHYLALINQSAQHVLKLLEDLLSWARTQTGRTEFNPVNLKVSHLIDETIQLQLLTANAKKISINKGHIAPLVTFADRNMVLTILRNILANAIKYTNRGGSIEIESGEQYFNNKQFVVIAVKDSGTGIPKDKLDKIFKIEENFSTLGTEKEKGTGLGLILCKEFVEINGGKIWCESTENVGSTFFISLPVSH